jgi:hypothetical protein
MPPGPLSPPASPPTRSPKVRALALFLALAGCVGAFFAIATPPHDPADEARHHARAWLVSQGRFGVVGRAPDHEAAIPREILRLHPPGHHHSEAQLRAGRFPRSTPPSAPHTLSELRARTDEPAAGAEFRFVRLLTPYNAFVYVPYAPGFWVAEGFSLSATSGLWLARLLGLAAWIAAIGFALVRAPNHRWLLAACALLPLSVFQAASISADPLTQAAAFVFFAEWLRLTGREPSADASSRFGGLMAASLALGLVKPGYAPLALACLGLPGPMRRRLALALASFTLIAVPTLGWAAIAIAADEPPLVPGADAFAQLRFILANPLTFLGALANTIGADAARWSLDLIGTLGHLDVEIPAGASALGLAAVVASATLDPGRLPVAARLAAVGAAIASVFALLFLAYVGWASVGADYIPAFQARYLLPLLPFAGLAIPPLPAAAARLVGAATAFALALVLAIGAVAMVSAYYA